MVIKEVTLETVCGITSTLPENDKPEIAFAGKSNVGKSSLINALMNRKSLARISATPGKTIERYLHKSTMLKAVFLLIDIRHDPSKNDKMMYDWILHQGYEPVIIATKLDKLKKSQVAKQLKAIRTGLGLVSGTTVIPFSAKTKQGRDEIWEYAESRLFESVDKEE